MHERYEISYGYEIIIFEESRVFWEEMSWVLEVVKARGALITIQHKEEE